MVVPLCKRKGGIKGCGNYRRIKLISHTIKLWERTIEARIRKEVTIAEQQFGFIIMDKLTENIRKDAPWDMLFADDIVLS